jgi:hypothetical protein
MSLVGTPWLDPPTCRRAGTHDARAIADVLIRSRLAAADAIPASVHSDAEVREWVNTVVVAEREVWLTEDAGGRPSAVLVLDGD